VLRNRVALNVAVQMHRFVVLPLGFVQVRKPEAVLEVQEYF
jgi:hypothetical protein